MLRVMRDVFLDINILDFFPSSFIKRCLKKRICILIY